MKVKTPQWLKSGGSVSPGFIRKYQDGTSQGGVSESRSQIGDMKFTNTYPDSEAFWKQYGMEVAKHWEWVFANMPNKTLDAFNTDIAGYYDARPASYQGNPSKAILDIKHGTSEAKTNPWQQLYHNTYQFGRDNIFSQAFTQNYSNSSTVRTDRKWTDTNYTGDDYWGWQTEQRRMNFFNQEQLKVANYYAKQKGWHWEIDKRAENMPTVNGFQYYRLAEGPEPDSTKIASDEDIKKLTNPTPETSLIPGEKVINNGQAPEEQTNEKKQEDTKSPINTGKPAEFPATGDKDPFMIDTYPAEQMFRLGQILSAAQQQFNLKAQERVPLKEPMPILYKQGQYYATNQALEQQKASAQNTLRNQSNSTSDLAVGNATMTNGTVNLAQQIGTQQAQNIQQTHNKDVEQQMTVDQYNNKQEQDIWNENEQNLVAGQNMYLKALEELLQNRTAAIQQTEENLSTHYHKKWLDNNLDAVAAGHFAQQDALQKKMQDLREQYQNATDFTKSSQFQQLVDHIKANFNNYQQQLTQSGNDAVALAKILWNNADDPQAISLKSQFDTESANTIELLKKQMNDLYNQSAMNNNAFSYRQGHISNEFGIYPKKSKPSPIFNVPIAKKGTKVDWYEAFSREHRKAQERHDRNNKQANDRTNTNLNKQLDRISKEELILLRSIFK